MLGLTYHPIISLFYFFFFFVFSWLPRGWFNFKMLFALPIPIGLFYFRNWCKTMLTGIRSGDILWYSRLFQGFSNIKCILIIIHLHKCFSQDKNYMLICNKIQWATLYVMIRLDFTDVLLRKETRHEHILQLYSKIKNI